jgi:hypothetical protein
MSFEIGNSVCNAINSRPDVTLLSRCLVLGANGNHPGDKSGIRTHDPDGAQHVL